MIKTTENFSYFFGTKIKLCLDVQGLLLNFFNRQGSPSEALMLAKRHGKHDWYIKLLIEDHQKYVEVLDYISGLIFENATFYMKKYGSILIEKVPNESTQFLKKLCTNYKPKDSLMVSESALTGSYDIPQHAEPEDFIHLFLNNSERLVEFLEYVIEEGYVHYIKNLRVRSKPKAFSDTYLG